MLRFLIVFLFTGVFVFGQDPDTLLQHILKIENDTLCTNQLYTQGYALVERNPQLAFAYAQNCEKTARKSRSQRHIAKSCNLLGILFYNQGNFKKAIVYFEKYLSATKALNNTLGEAFSYTNLGNSYLQLKQFLKAEKFYLSAIEYYNISNNKEELANGLINLGVLKHEQKQLDAALYNYTKALEIGKALNDYKIRSICLNNLAQILSDKGDFEKALAFNYDALELREIMGLDVDVTDSYLSIAEIALKQKNIALAEENLILALGLSTKLEYFEGKMVYHKLLSELYSQKNNYQLAYENLKLYHQLNESLVLMQHNEPSYDFTDIEEPSYNCTESPIKNLWLLVLLSLTLITIPFVLIRYKR